MESVGEGGGPCWRVKRVWDDPILDSREVERIVADEHLLNMVRNLSGLPAIEAADFVNHKNDDHIEKNKDKRGDDDAENVDNDNKNDMMDLSHWSIKKFYDIDGEIVDEL